MEQRTEAMVHRTEAPRPCQAARDEVLTQGVSPYSLQYIKNPFTATPSGSAGKATC